MMRSILIALAVGIAIGLATYHWLLRPQPVTTTETFRPGHVQVDGSVDLTRIPTAPADAGQAPHVLPKGATETSRAHVVVRPRPRAHVPAGKQEAGGPDHVSQPGNMACSCDPITIDLSQYTGPGGSGIVASSPTAEVDVHASTYTPMLEPAPRLDRFVAATTEPGRDAYTLAIGKRFLAGRVGLSIGGAKQPGQDARPLVGIQINW